MSAYLAMTVSLDDRVTPALQAIVSRLANKTPLNQSMAMGVETKVVENFQRKATIPNKFDAPSTGYWQKAAASVRASATSSYAEVAIPFHGVRLHYLGGTIVPVNKKWLTIPARAEAHGKRVVDLFPGFTNCVWLFNAARQPYAIAGKEDGLVYFWLAKKAVIKPDPTVLPPVAVMQEAALEGATEYLNQASS